MSYKSNRYILYACKHHVVFCPKHRPKVLVSGVDKRLKAIICQVAKELGCEILELEVTPALRTAQVCTTMFTSFAKWTHSSEGINS